MGYLINFSKEGFATSTHYLNVSARQTISLKKSLVELNPDNSEYNAALDRLKTLIRAIPRANYKTKKDQERFENAQANASAQWKAVFKILEKKLNLVAVNKELITFAEESGNLEKLGEFYLLRGKKLQSAQAYTYAGIVELKKKNNKKALGLFMEAWTLDSSDKYLLNTLGDFFIADKKVDKAKQYLEMSLFLYPEQEEIKRKLETLK